MMHAKDLEPDVTSESAAVLLTVQGKRHRRKTVIPSREEELLTRRERGFVCSKRSEVTTKCQSCRILGHPTATN